MKVDVLIGEFVADGESRTYSKHIIGIAAGDVAATERRAVFNNMDVAPWCGKTLGFKVVGIMLGMGKLSKEHKDQGAKKGKGTLSHFKSISDHKSNAKE